MKHLRGPVQWHYYPRWAIPSPLYHKIPTSLTLCAGVSTRGPLTLGTGSDLPITGSCHHLPALSHSRQVPNKYLSSDRLLCTIKHPICSPCQPPAPA